MKNNLSQAAIFFVLLFALSLAGFAQEPEELPPAAGDPSEIAALQDADIVIGLEEEEPEVPVTTVPLPSGVTLRDLPNDDGTGLYLTWEAFPEESPELTYTAYLAETPNGPWLEAGSIAGNESYMEDHGHYFPIFYWFKKSREAKLHHVLLVQDVATGEFDAKGNAIRLPEPEGFTVRPNVGPKNKDGRPIEPGIIDPDTGEEKVSTKLVEIQPRTIGELYVKLEARLGDATAEYPEVLSATARENWFDVSKTNMLILAVLFGATVLYFISRARRDPNLFIRKINGLDAVDEAIGRATEMGKPILYLNGMSSLADLSTLAALNILGRVARRVANYESTLVVPCRDPIVLTVAQEIVKAGFADAGRPDAYNEDNIFFLTEDQFSYAAAVCGIMMRDKPAANFFMGYYYAESLILAETGASTGAIQIAGTDAVTQLPFFVTTCDYTLIGEELYAASAYLSREPLVLGSLKGQDMAKLFMMVVILIGTLLVTFGMSFVKDLFKALG